MSVCANCGISQGPFRVYKTLGSTYKICGKGQNMDKAVHDCVERRRKIDNLRYNIREV